MNTIIVTSQVSVQLLDENAVLTLDELCRACAMPAEFIVELIDEGIVQPRGPTP